MINQNFTSFHKTLNMIYTMPLKLKNFTLSFLQGDMKNYKETQKELITEIYCKELNRLINKDNKY